MLRVLLHSIRMKNLMLVSLCALILLTACSNKNDELSQINADESVAKKSTRLPPKLKPYIKNCSEVRPDAAICRRNVDYAPETIERHLAETDFAYWINEAELNLLARSDADAVRLTGTIQEGMFPLFDTDETTYWGASYRLPNIDQSILNLSLRNGPPNSPKLNFVGPNAPNISTYSDELEGNFEVATIDSLHLNSKRNLHIYTPPNNKISNQMPIVFMADGQWIEQYVQIADALISKNTIRPILIVGIANGVDPKERHTAGLRGKEYLQGWDEDAFDAHENFFLKEAIPYVEKRFSVSDDRQDRLLHGYSNAGAWVITMANKHANLVGHVAASSVSGVVDQDFRQADGVKFYLQAGYYEPLFLEPTKIACFEAKQAGLNCSMAAYYAGHTGAIWKHHFEKVLLDVFSK